MKKISLAVVTLTLTLTLATMFVTGCASGHYAKSDPTAKTTLDPMPGVGPVESARRTVTITMSSTGSSTNIVMDEINETPGAAQLRLRMKQLENQTATQTNVGAGIGVGIMEELSAPLATPMIVSGQPPLMVAPTPAFYSVGHGGVGYPLHPPKCYPREDRYGGSFVVGHGGRRW